MLRHMAPNKDPEQLNIIIPTRPNQPCLLPPRLSHQPLSLDVLNHLSLDGLVETVIGGGKVMSAAVALAEGVGAAGAGGLLLEGGLEGGVAGHGLVGGRQEDDLGVGALGHGLHGLEVADLHGRRRGEDVGGLAHEFGGFDLEEGRRVSMMI
jgi:hypothetical protein